MVLKVCQQMTFDSKQRNLFGPVHCYEMVQTKSISTLMCSDCYKEGYLSLAFSNLHLAGSTQTVCES